jgi:nickel-dependent lactate racemase
MVLRQPVIDPHNKYRKYFRKEIFMEIKIPVGGKDEVIDIPQKNILEIIMPQFAPAVENAEEKIREAVMNPIGTKRLSEIAKERFGKPGKRGGPYNRVTIIADSYNRPTKHFLLFPPILEELQKAGIKDEDIFIVEGCGVHRGASPDEWERKWGKEFRARFKDRMFSHSAPPPEYEKFQSPVKFLGLTKHNCPVCINTYAAESDVLIVLGQISMNAFYAYGGGAKMILPGITSYEGIVLSHGLTPPGTRGGGNWRENPARSDINEMGDIAGIDFLVNVAHNVEGGIIAAAAGEHCQAWESLIPVIQGMYVKQSVKPADIYIASASPRHTLSGAFATDHSWAIAGGNNATKKGGTMIIAHRAVWPQHPIAHKGCPWFKICEDKIKETKPGPMEELVRRCFHHPEWADPSILRGSLIMNEKEVVVTGEGYRDKDFEGSGFHYIPEFSKAIEYAFNKHGKDASVNVSPYGGRFTYCLAEGANGDFADCAFC